jgi:hypothetical protein
VWSSTLVLKTIDASSILGYSVSVVTLVMGVAVIAGLLVNDNVPSQLRYTFGTVLMLMSVYRFALTRSKVTERRSHEEDEE